MVPDEIDKETVDFSFADKIIEEKRNESLNYILCNLENAMKSSAPVTKDGHDEY